VPVDRLDKSFWAMCSAVLTSGTVMISRMLSLSRVDVPVVKIVMPRSYSGSKMMELR